MGFMCISIIKKYQIFRPVLQIIIQWYEERERKDWKGREVLYMFFFIVLYIVMEEKVSKREKKYQKETIFI